MGAVYQARDMKRQGTLCAIKEMSLSMVPPEDQALAIKNFRIEAKMLSVLGHPCLPAFTHFFAENERYFLVMEYIEGATLEDLLERNRRPFSERRVLNWAEQLCDVLEYLHSQNPPIIFRDMKPGNVMLTRQGHIKLIDFGIARFFRPTHETDTQLLGTPGYAPPEQYGKTQTDERSDIYALGMTLHHLLTYDFSETGFGTKAREIRAINPHVSVSVACALEKATALELSDRYETIADFRHALLGTGAFTFETGETASEPTTLAKLCARYPEEAFEYLESGEIAKWLYEIGEEDLSAIAKHIRITQPDPRLAVEEFLHAVLGPTSQVSSLSRYHGSNGNGQHTVDWVNEESREDVYDTWLTSDYDNSAQHYVSTQTALSSRASTHASGYGIAVAVKPKTLDFGPVYPPNSSAPLRIAIHSTQNLSIKGTIQASEAWIRLDRTEFDGMNTYVNVQIRSAQLHSYTSYKGEVIISPEGGRPITVAVGADIQGYTSQARRPGKTISPEDDDEDDDQDTRRPTPVMALDQDALTKYGPPNETASGWDASMASAQQQVRSRYGFTFTTACMTSVLWYIFLTQIFHQTPLLPPPWPGFALLLAGMVPASTLGALLVGQPHLRLDREMANRFITGISGALLVLGPAYAFLEILAGTIGSASMLILLALTALGATYSTHPTVSRTVWSHILVASRRARYIHRLIVTAATIIGAVLGYSLTVGLRPGGSTVFGIMVGIAITLAFIDRLRHLLKLYRRA
jgi:serine/threonine protein kinase